ncbi:hypothetical protein [Streptomyces sp. NPDC046332]|uniref:hypothetical protein n=1 Tax=Streptomyces sp. NPDC046332 TaxID=3155133 RepID=UPI0033EBBD0E
MSTTSCLTIASPTTGPVPAPGDEVEGSGGRPTASMILSQEQNRYQRPEQLRIGAGRSREHRPRFCEVGQIFVLKVSEPGEVADMRFALSMP